MAAAKLKLVGRYRAWHDGVREGQLRGEDGSLRRVLIRPLADIPAEQKVLQALRAEAMILAHIQHQNVLKVEHVTAMQGRAALVLEAFGGISLARVLEMLAKRHQAVPVRAIVEIVTTVAGALDAATALIPGVDEHCVVHPGPEPGEILVDSLGRVKLAGFRVCQAGQPVPPSPEGYGPPEDIDPYSPTAYGLGALLVELLTGSPPPPPGTDAASHERTLRRTTTRIAAKVGQAGWEDLVRIARATMAYDPQARLSPAAFARELRAHALEQRSPRLRTWAPAAIPTLTQHLDPSKLARGLVDPSAVAPPPPLPDPEEGRPTVVGPTDPEQRAFLEAAFGPPRDQQPDDESEELATEVVSPELLARVRAGSLEPGSPPALTPPPSLPPLNSAPVKTDTKPLPPPAALPAKPSLADGQLLPPLPIPDEAPKVKWSADDLPGFGDEQPASSDLDPPTEDAVELGTEEAPTAEHDKAPPVVDPGAISPAGLDPTQAADEPPTPRRRRSPLILLVPIAAALLLGAWTAWFFLPGLLASLRSEPVPSEPNELLTELLTDPDPAPDPVNATEPPDPADPDREFVEGSQLPQLPDLDLPTPPDRTEDFESPSAGQADPTASPTPDPDPVDTTSARELAIAAIREEQPSTPDPAPAPPDPSPDGTASLELEPDPVTSEPPTSDPDPVPEPPPPESAQAEVEPESEPGLFRVEFQVGHPDVYELEVRCHQGSATGAPPLVLNDAGKGPCRVTAFTSASGRMIAWIGLTGPATLTCFEDGQRSCR